MVGFNTEWAMRLEWASEEAEKGADWIVRNFIVQLKGFLGMILKI